MMRLFLKSILLFFTLLIILNYPISYFIDNNFHTYNKQNWILTKEGYEFDYAVLGSSRVFNVVDIVSMNRSYGKKGINLGTSGSNYAENFLILNEFIKKNRITTLILNVDEFSFNSSNSFAYPFHEYEFLPLFNEYEDLFKDFVPNWKLFFWKVIPVAKYCEFNTRFTLKKTTQNTFDETMGSRLENITVKDEEQLEFKRRQYEVKEIDKKYFQRILQLCSEKGIKIIFITTPIYDTNEKVNNESFLNYINFVSVSQKIPYYSFTGLLDNEKKYFKDNTHLNAKGASIYSLNLGKALKQGDLLKTSRNN